MTSKEVAVNLWSLLCHLCMFTFGYGLPRHGTWLERFWCSIFFQPDFYSYIHPNTFLADLTKSTPPQAVCLGSSPCHTPTFALYFRRVPHLCIHFANPLTVRQSLHVWREKIKDGRTTQRRMGDVEVTLKPLMQNLCMAFRDSMACQREVIKSSINKKNLLYREKGCNQKGRGAKM